MKKTKVKKQKTPKKQGCSLFLLLMLLALAPVVLATVILTSDQNESGRQCTDHTACNCG